MIRTRAQRAATKNRAYDACHAANPGKVARVAAILPHWQRGLVHVQMLQVRALRRGEGLNLMDTRHLPDYLTQRQWKSVVNQVNAGLRSWAELTVSKLARPIYELGLDEAERRRLLTLSRRYEWWTDPTLAPMLTRLARTSHPLPNFAHVRTMLMDNPIAQVEDSKDSTFRWWVRISLPGGAKPVRVPLAGNPYMDDQPGTIARYAQVSVHQDEAITVGLIKASAKADPRTTGEVIGLDWGLANLLTTSDGRRYGQALYAWLQDRDTELTALTAALQRQGIRPKDSKRYRNLNRRIRSYVTNEVGRILNTITTDDLAEIVVENLDFRGATLSRRLNRILSRAGRAVLTQRLAALTEDHGITITTVNPAYTSQQCSGCGYTAKHNRTTQDRLRCHHCGKTIHADVNAARNIRRRRSSPVAPPHTPKREVLAHLDQTFTAHWGMKPDRVRERQPRPHSRATSRPTARGQLAS